MKKLIIILLALSIISCHNKEEVKPEVVTTFSVKKNGEIWNGNTEFRLYQVTDTLIIFGTSRNPEATVTMKLKFQGIGSYSLTGSQGTYFTTLGGDVVTSEYKIDNNSMGQLVITKYDPSSRAIEGNFSFVVQKFYDYFATSAPSIAFTEGSFNGIIKVINIK